MQLRGVISSNGMWCGGVPTGTAASGHMSATAQCPPSEPNAKIGPTTGKIM